MIAGNCDEEENVLQYEEEDGRAQLWRGVQQDERDQRADHSRARQ